MTTDAARIETLVRELIATGTMWPETIADLERFVEEARAGTLSRDDEDYLVAFHAKSVLDAAPDDSAAQPAEDWRARAERAEARVAELEDQIRILTAGKG
jgi:hypothetical protein